MFEHSFRIGILEPQLLPFHRGLFSMWCPADRGSRGRIEGLRVG